VIARDRFNEIGLRPRPFDRFTDGGLCPDERFAFGGGGRLTPALRAFESPIAIACFVERAPCLPSRMCSISSLTNSPACVVGAFPARLSHRARSSVVFSGISRVSSRAARNSFIVDAHCTICSYASSLIQENTTVAGLNIDYQTVSGVKRPTESAA
jgi:hypothetical protein